MNFLSKLLAWLAVEVACIRVDQWLRVQHIFGCLVIWSCFMGIIFTWCDTLSTNGTRWIEDEIEWRLSNGKTWIRHSNYVNFQFIADKFISGWALKIINHCSYRHDVILSCWCCNPEKRPKFSDLERTISQILGKSDSEHYVDLNEPYLEANESRFNSGETDYMALLGSPDSQAPSVPVNELREKYFPFLAKSLDDTLIATNGLYVTSETPKLNKKGLNTSTQSITLKTFRRNNLNWFIQNYNS